MTSAGTWTWSKVLLVHEVKAIAVLIKEAEFMIFDVGALDLVGGLVAL